MSLPLFHSHYNWWLVEGTQVKKFEHVHSGHNGTPPVNRQTRRTENIVFPQFRSREITIRKVHKVNTALNGVEMTSSN